MKKTFSAIGLSLILIQLAPSQSTEPILLKTIGAAEVFYYKDKDKTRSQVRIYLQGKANDVGTQKETLSMDVIFETNGQKVSKPQMVNIAFRAYSPKDSKITNDHDLQLYIEGMEGKNSKNYGTKLLTTQQLPSGGKVEIFLSPQIEYERIVRMANAMVTRVTLGRATYTLKNEDMQALKDLSRTIEK